MRHVRFAIPATLSLLSAACKDPVDPLEVTVTVEVRSETGSPVSGARVDLGRGETLTTDKHGKVKVRLKTAELAIVSATGSLDEPLAIGRDDGGQVVSVKLWAASGRRWVMHSAGDVMFGRRYSAPTEGPALIDLARPADGARHVVDAIKPAFITADVRTVNLETVVSTLGASEAYPGKRFILNSPPEALAALDALGVDAVDLANNHGRDYLTRGIDATVRALADNTLSSFGGTGRDDDSPPAPLVIDARHDVKVGFLGWTSVDGSFVNDSYPVDGAAVPPDILPEDMWQYEPRTWGYEGATWSAPMAPRRIGTAWRLFAEIEPTLSAEESRRAWTQLTAVYPELQDWVQRRGHSGAAAWHAESPRQIETLAASTDLVVVQLHAGFQFQPAPSVAVRKMAHAAIDAGADIVICHHPHVLQGAEWYKGKLVVYSLGNFVFDQNFGSTFPSMFLRTIWDGATLVEARLIPLELAGYRPMAVTDEAAARTMRGVWEMSLMDAFAERDAAKAVRVFASGLDADTKRAHLRIERNSAVVTADEPTTSELELRVPAGRSTAIATRGLVDPRLGVEPALEIGRELLRWGGFEDNHADGIDDAGPQWNADSGSEKPVFVEDAYDGIAYLRLTRDATNKNVVVSRPVARVTLVPHRLHRDQGGVAIPIDPPARYSFRMRARLTGSATPGMRVDLYHFDDSDPTEDPTSLQIGRITLPLDVPRDGQWHEVELPVETDALVGTGGLRANQLMPYVQLDVPTKGNSHLDVDALEIIEWRRGDAMPDRFGAYDYVRNSGTRDHVVKLKVLGAP